MRSLVILSLAIFAFAQIDAKLYKDSTSFSSRQPGDQLIWHSSHATQKLDFFATVSVEVRFPQQDLPHSDYTLTNVLITGQDDTGYLDGRFDAGGPGADFMRLKIFFNSIQNGDFEVFLYGKKK